MDLRFCGSRSRFIYYLFYDVTYRPGHIDKVRPIWVQFGATWDVVTSSL